MMFYGMGSSDVSGLFNSASKTNSSISLSDWSMIKSGSYKKLLTAYYKIDRSGENSKEESGKVSDSVKQSMTVANSADNLADKMEKFSSIIDEYDEKVKTVSADEADKLKDNVYKAASQYIEAYNSTLDSAVESDNNSVLRNVVSMTKNTKANKKLLEAVGISIDKDNKLSIDEKKFKEADVNDLKSLFTGHGSYGSHISRTSVYLKNIATAASASENKAASYLKNGSYSALMSNYSTYNSRI